MPGQAKQNIDFEDPAAPNRSETGASADDVADNRDPATEKALDEGLEGTFPASDPVSISPRRN